MSGAGLNRFVVESAAQYVDIAVGTAAQPEELQRLRASLRSRLEEDACRVPAQVARALERRLRQMWQRWCAGLAPCVLDQ
jgi:predicted O-linked N-acetylglucosamine transferase (SPINDLY family)